MRLTSLKSKIFLDGGDPEETKKLINKLGFLDGQTTNPSLIAKNPEAAHRIEEDNLFSNGELLEFYKGVVQDVAKSVPDGSVSIEVYADELTTPNEMFVQGQEMFSWIPNAHIKYPTTTAGLEAAARSVKEKMRINMTLVFSQEQAAAVYAATLGASKGQVFVSPFVGRLDDKGQNGMELIKNIVEMYKTGDGHVEVLTASVRNVEHFKYALKLGSDIITAPYKITAKWVDGGMVMPDESYEYDSNGLSAIAYQELDLSVDWRDFNIKHELTDVGIDKFVADWKKLLKP